MTTPDTTAVLEHAVLIALAPADELGCSFGDLRDSLEELVASPRLAVLLDTLTARGEVARYEGGFYMLTPAGRRRVAAGPAADREPAPRPTTERRPALADRRARRPAAKADEPGARIGPWRLVAPIPGKRAWVCECTCGVLARHQPNALRRARRERTLRPCAGCAPRVVTEASREWAYQDARERRKS